MLAGDRQTHDAALHATLDWSGEIGGESWMKGFEMLGHAINRAFYRLVCGLGAA
jgi:hypothetical protein